MKRLLWLCVVLLLWSCEKQTLTPEELSAFVADEENGYCKKSTVGPTTVTVTYRPTDLLVDQELGDEAATTLRVDSLRKKYDRYYYFILSLSSNEKESLHQTSGDQYSDLVNTLSFRMHDFVTMTTSASDTIPVGDFMLNRTYGMSSSTDLLFVFNKEKSKDQDWVQFNLNEFGLGVGNQRFRFSVDELEAAPKIKFD